MSTNAQKLQHLKRLRWGVFGGVALGIAVSVAANVLHAEDNPISQAIAAWPPLSLFIGIELVSRIPSSSRWLSILRVIATLGVAGVAAAISWSSMVGAVQTYGEDGWQSQLWPVTVDGLMIIASVSLVEVVAKIRQLQAAEDAAAETVAQVVAEAAAKLPVPVSPAPAGPAAPTTAAMTGAVATAAVPMTATASATTTAPRPRPAVRAATSRTRRTTLTAKLPDGYSVSDDRRVVRPDGRVLSKRHSRRYINGTK